MLNVALYSVLRFLKGAPSTLLVLTCVVQ